MKQHGFTQDAFTLAEVLITLGIIGMVASMTLPALFQKYTDSVLITQGKKSYSNFSNVLNQMKSEEDCIDYECIFSGGGAAVAKNIAKYYNGAKVCTVSGKDCGASYIVKLARATNNGSGGILKESFSYPRILLNDGSIIFFREVRDTCAPYTVTAPVKDADGFYTGETRTYTETRCATVIIDINGEFKGPNQYGADVHQIIVQKEKLEPNDDLFGGLKSIFSKNKLNYSKYSDNTKFEKSK